jgi:pyrroloquinoline quinone biosynthesis protein B
MSLLSLILGGVAMASAHTCPVELVVLGTAQDGGAPQIGQDADPAWTNPALRRTATSLGVIDREAGKRWLFEASPDMRDQLYRFDQAAPVERKAPGLDGVFLTHAHMGHYVGLMFFGFESIGTRDLPVYAMPRMTQYLTDNGPWSQLVRFNNIKLTALADRRMVNLGSIKVTPLAVPHRQEFSEVVGFRIEGPNRKVLFIPDIDSWEQWDALGVRIEDEIARADVAYLDATFYADGELPGRDMSKIPHPMIAHSMARFAALPASERDKIRFIHLNSTNPARFPDSEARRTIEAGGFRVAEENERVCL